MSFIYKFFRWALASSLLLICFFVLYKNVGESMKSSIFSVAGYSFNFPENFLTRDGSRPDGGSSEEIVLDVGYPGGGAVEEFGPALREGDSIRLFVSDQGVSPQHAMENILKYRGPVQQSSDPALGYIKYRVMGGATIDYYYFSELSVFVSCIVDADIDVSGNPMCRANFGQIIPDVYVSAVFSESLVSKLIDILTFVRDFLETHIGKEAS